MTFGEVFSKTLGTMLKKTPAQIDTAILEQADEQQADNRNTINLAAERLGETAKNALAAGTNFAVQAGLGAMTGNGIAGKTALLPPDAIIGFIPIEIVTYYDFAESDSIVKYRAFGGEYFAHQGGDKNAMRVDFLLVGPNKDIFIYALLLLRSYSKSTVAGKPLFNQDESYIADPVNASGEGLWALQKVERRRAVEWSMNPEGMTNMTSAELESATGAAYNNWDSMTRAERFEALTGTKYDDYNKMSPTAKRNVIPKDLDKSTAQKLAKSGYAVDPTTQNAKYWSKVPSKNVDVDTIERHIFSEQSYNTADREDLLHGDKFYDLQKKGYYTYHYNYPCIIKNMVFNNMWIETVQFTHDSRDGIDAIRGHLLLRKYIRPPRIRWSANGRQVAAISGRVDPQSTSETLTQAVDVTPGGTGGSKNTLTRKETWKIGRFPSDSKVWTWEEKRNDAVEYSDIVAGLTLGVSRAMMRRASPSFINMPNNEMRRVAARIMV